MRVASVTIPRENKAMKVILLAVQLLFTTYDSGFDQFPKFIGSAIGEAFREADCTIHNDETNPSCVAYCYGQLELVGLPDSLPVCVDVVKMRIDNKMHVRQLKRFNDTPWVNVDDSWYENGEVI